jgi:hypothetical protein
MKNRARLKPRSAGVATGAMAGTRCRFRRLKSREMVYSGDYVKDAARGFEPWEGPGGFRASSFAKPVYRLRRAALSRSISN